MQAVSIGPWVLAVGVIALLLGMIGAQCTAAFLKKRGGADAGSALWGVLLLALVVARLAWVVRWWSAYGHQPWAIVDIRDGGFSWLAGVLALLVATLFWAWRRPALRRTLPISAGAGVAAWALTGLIAWQLQQATHPPLPDTALQRLDGGTTTLAKLRGKPMVVNLWATWCGPCRREMPMLVAASHSMPEVRFVFVDQGESADAVRAWLDSTQLAPTHVLVDGARDLSRYYHVPGYPTTLFIDASGRLRDIRVGPLTAASLRVHLQRADFSSAE